MKYRIFSRRLVGVALMVLPFTVGCTTKAERERQEDVKYETVGFGTATDSIEREGFGFAVGPLTINPPEDNKPRHKETFGERRARIAKASSEPKEVEDSQRLKELIEGMRKQKAAGKEMQIPDEFEDARTRYAMLEAYGAKECMGRDLEKVLMHFFGGKTKGSREFIKRVSEAFGDTLYVDDVTAKPFIVKNSIAILPGEDSDTWEDKSIMEVTLLFDRTCLFEFSYYHEYDSRNFVDKTWNLLVTIERDGSLTIDYDRMFIAQS